MTPDDTDALDMLAPDISEADAAQMEDGENEAVKTEGQTTEEEAKSEDTGDAEDEGRKPGLVPHAALHEAREDLKTTRTELTQTRERMARMEGLFEQLQRGQAGQESAAEQVNIPAYEDDPEGHYQARIAQLEQMVGGINTAQADRVQAEAQRGQWDQAMNGYQAAAHEFAAKEPDFGPAYAWLVGAIGADLEARGYADPAERAQILQYEEAGIVGRALQAGKNPAEAVYAYAKARGYTPQARDLATGQFAKAETDEDKLARLEKGTATTRSLTNTRGAAEDGVTLERLAEMADQDPEAFDREWEILHKRGALG